jgi:hypothetical protein
MSVIFLALVNFHLFEEDVLNSLLVLARANVARSILWLPLNSFMKYLVRTVAVMPLAQKNYA